MWGKTSSSRWSAMKMSYWSSSWRWPSLEAWFFLNFDNAMTLCMPFTFFDISRSLEACCESLVKRQRRVPGVWIGCFKGLQKQWSIRFLMCTTWLTSWPLFLWVWWWGSRRILSAKLLDHHWHRSSWCDHREFWQIDVPEKREVGTWWATWIEPHYVVYDLLVSRRYLGNKGPWCWRLNED